jgi:hypothetical protein
VLIVVLVKLLNIHVCSYFQSSINLIGGVMFGVLASSALDHGIESRSGQTKYNKTGCGCFPACSTKEQEQKKKPKKNKLARNQDNVSEWSNMFFHGLLFQCAGTIQIQKRVLYKVNIISLKCNLFSP